MLLKIILTQTTEQKANKFNFFKTFLQTELETFLNKGMHCRRVELFSNTLVSLNKQKCVKIIIIMMPDRPGIHYLKKNLGSRTIGHQGFVEMSFCKR